MDYRTLTFAVKSGEKARCSECALAELCFSKGLTKQALQELDERVYQSELLPRGAHLFRVNDPLEVIHAVQTGCFKSYVIDESGREHVLEFHLPGDLIGLEGLYSGRHRSNALALGKASVCVLHCEDLSATLQQIPGLDRRLITLMSRDVANAQAMARYLSAEERLAAFLLDLRARLARRGGSPADLVLDMPRRDIGNYLGLATETVSRILTQFRGQNYIAVARERIQITDAGGLCKVARLVPSFLN